MEEGRGWTEAGVEVGVVTGVECGIETRVEVGVDDGAEVAVEAGVEIDAAISLFATRRATTSLEEMI